MSSVLRNVFLSKYCNSIIRTDLTLLRTGSRYRNKSRSQICADAGFTTTSEATFEIKPFKLYRLDKGPSTKCTLNSKDALKYYTNMMVMRQMETAATVLYKAKFIRGFCHLYPGQEAVAVGIHDAMRKIDTLITSYRCHGFTYIMGGTVLGVLAELTGRKSGCARGKGGSMHMYGPPIFFGGNGIVGAQVPLGTGLAFVHKYRKDGGITYTLYGDGAANQGQYYESLNMAALWKLPCVYICENNLYGLGTSAARSSANTEYYKRGDLIPGIWVDGMDVLACREVTRFAIEYVTSGKGPLVIEMETYRYHGHSMSDPGTSYRTREEVATVRKTRDPITHFRDKIIEGGLVTKEEIKALDKKISKDVKEQAEKARTDPEVPPEELAADIYYTNLHDEIRNCSPGEPLQHIEVQPRK